MFICALIKEISISSPPSPSLATLIIYSIFEVYNFSLSPCHMFCKILYGLLPKPSVYFPIYPTNVLANNHAYEDFSEIFPNQWFIKDYSSKSWSPAVRFERLLLFATLSRQQKAY